MDNKRWTAVAGVLLLAGIVASAIFLQQRNEARQRWHESRDQIADLERRYAELNERQAELDTVRKHLQEAKGETARLQGKLASTVERIAGLTRERNELGEERKTLTSRIESMESEEVKKRTAIVMLEKQAEGQNEMITALGKKIQTLGDTMVAKEKELAEIQNLHWALEAETEDLRKDLAAVKQSADKLEARMKELTDEREGLIAQTKALEAEGGGLREHIAEMETRYREALAVGSEKITTLSSALEDSGKLLDDLEKDKSILISKLKEANLTITGLGDQLQEVISRVPELKDSLEQSQEKYQAVRGNLTETRARQAKLEAEQKAMRETYEALVAGLEQQLDSQEASIEEYREKLKVTFVNRILFGFSQVRISPEGKAVLDQLAEVLANIPDGRISIIGHADNIPVLPKFRYRFPSNWELSSARAAVVARHLLKQMDLDPSLIEVVGLSSYKPVADNDTEAGRAKNRRVEIIITPGRYPD